MTALRRRLHRAAERSGREVVTADLLRAVVEATKPDGLVLGLGGHGLAAIYAGTEPGPTVLVRCDMDALPIPESQSLRHASSDPATSHRCGHDGHMAMVTGVALALADRRPARGRAVLLYQPAEETGAGAAAVLADPAFAPLRPDRVVALHNLPGFPAGAVVLRHGVFCSASRGMVAELVGVSSHAAEPDAGRSPVPAAAHLALALDTVPGMFDAADGAIRITVVGLEVGGPAFGTCPGRGRVMATLRAADEPTMGRLVAAVTGLVGEVARDHGLEHGVDWVEIFPATANHGPTVDLVAGVAEDLGLAVIRPDDPFPWSEDFGHFTAAFPGALCGLGAGEGQPALHHPDYDFPDGLIPTGVALLEDTVRSLLSNGDP